MSAALNVQDATETYDCKVFGCLNQARSNRGKHAYLCDFHAEQAGPAAVPADRSTSPSDEESPSEPVRYTCREPGCSAVAKSDRGPFSRCDEHRGVARTQGASVSDGFEGKAKALVALGKRLDKATAAYKPAKEELEEAMAEWRSACRALAGEPTP